MRIQSLAPILALSVLFGASAGAIGQSQARRSIVLSHASPPGTIEEIVLGVEVIIVGRVVDTEQVLLGSAELPVPTVKHRVLILEVIKGPKLKVGQTVVVSQPGGVAVSNGVEVSIHDRSFPVFLPRQELMLFLTHDPFFGSLASPWGPHGVVELEGLRATLPTALRERRGLPNAKHVSLAVLRTMIENVVKR